MRNYLSFKGISNADLGVFVTQMPPIPLPMERGEEIIIPGRNGLLWRSEGAYDPIDLVVGLYIPPTVSVETVLGWLTGSGALVLDAPDAPAYDARVVGDARFADCPYRDGRQGTITFRCQPFRRVACDPIMITASGQHIDNPFGAYAEPLVTVEGSGDVSISIAGIAFELAGLDGAVTLDSALQECYQGSVLRNDMMSGAFPILPLGRSDVLFTGSVTRLTIDPRWRTI